ncbi:hypothetical protein [Streptomyces sp. NPDC012825]|uniref:hypothetical protein n=1 Tax=Streptomyces sp. NPDC012825 TaxID=3364851 RepID=UPI0036ADD06C
MGFIVGAALEPTTHILAGFTRRCFDARVELHEYGFTDPSAGLTGGTTDVEFIRSFVDAAEAVRDRETWILRTVRGLPWAD